MLTMILLKGNVISVLFFNYLMTLLLNLIVLVALCVAQMSLFGDTRHCAALDPLNSHLTPLICHALNAYLTFLDCI